MPIKKVKYTYRGLNQDITKSKHPFEFYYDSNNIRIVTTDTQSTASLQNEKGNVQIVALPQIEIDTTNRIISYDGKNLSYTNDEIADQINEIGTNISGTNVIIGYGLTRDSILLFSTDDNGFDAIWEVKEIFDSNYDLELLYVRNLGFSIENPIQSIFNYESDIIQKIYWVDGKNQIRFLNIKQSIENGDLEELIDNNFTNINITGEYSLSQPFIQQITQGGDHTSGMIQYAFNLYKLNGSQTTISPLSELIPLDFGSGSGGGEINEVVGGSPLVNIEDLDERYTHIKLYAIKYTSFNQEPQISLIVDEEIDNYNLFSYFDDGSVINDLPLDEFLFLGSNVFIPRHIETKDNRMLAAAITDKSFDFKLDCRAYSHNSSGDAAVWNNVTVDASNTPIGTLTNLNTSTYDLSENHDAINPNYNIYRFQSNGSTLGGEGKFIKYELLQKTITQLENDDLRFNKFFKDNEIYRIAIQFYNSLGQISQPFWIADFRAPSGNLEGNYNTLNVEIDTVALNSFIAGLGLGPTEIPVGYKILRADRQANDRTVLCQGNLTGMMVQTTDDVTNFGFWIQGNAFGEAENRRLESLERPKFPMLTNRAFQDAGGGVTFSGKIYKYGHLRMMNEGDGGGDGNSQEIFRSGPRSGKRQQSWQYLKMMQMYTPDILFNTGLTFNSSHRLRIIGAHSRISSTIDNRNFNTNSETEVAQSIENGFGSSFTRGWYGPPGDDTDDRTINRNHKSIYNEYNNFIVSNNILDYYIYRAPEITERGQGNTSYGGDEQFNYTNSLQNLLSDRYTFSGQSEKNEGPITTANAEGSRCVTIVLGDETQLEQDRIDLQRLYNDTLIPQNDVLLMGEIIYPDFYAYVGNIYGGNTFEAKSRNSYIEIGVYQDITTNIIQIDSPGDTFVQIFNFGRILKADTAQLGSNVQQMSEIISYPVETSINLLNRNDLSLFGWDNKFQPREDEYHQYNRVYSQQPNLIQNQAESFKFKKTNSFDTQIIASKLKIPGETVDSWTDFLENERMDLDGKYGAINALVNFKDEIYALQDQGVAHISINPRVQVQGDDGVSLELGRGDILYDYEYISTTSGTINKWSVFNSPSGFYYLDTLNKAWYKYQGNLINLTDVHGLHAKFENNIDYTSLKKDNPLLKNGASGGYDFINNNAYLTVLQKEKPFTINFNENTNSFESFHDYKPSIYINKGHKMYTTSPDLNKLYEHDEGEYQTFYDVKYPSTITLQVNPEADLDCVFNNIEYKSELYLNDVDQPNQTLTHISCYNEYQDTSRVPLILRNNIRRKFRQWRAQIPRNSNSKDRIRNPWVFLKLELDTQDNYKLILHDIIINYTI